MSEPTAELQTQQTHLLATVLQIPHQGLLHSVELGQLHIDCLPRPLEVLRAFSEVLAALDTGRRDGERTLLKPS